MRFKQNADEGNLRVCGVNYLAESVVHRSIYIATPQNTFVREM